jgi:hypothetical protein
MTTIMLLMAFRLVIAAQAVAVLVQALLGGLALSGGAAALAAHMAVGGVTLLLSMVQVVAAFLLRRSVQIPRWPVAASIGFAVGDGVQMAVGRLQLFALHLPVGVGLFGAAIGLAIYAWTWRPAQIADPAGARGGHFALGGLPMGEKP